MKPRILIAEDEADIRRFVRMALEKEGMTIFEAGTAAQARMDAGSRKPEWPSSTSACPTTTARP